MMLCENNSYCITTNTLAKLIFQVTHLTKIRTFSEFLQEQYKISGLLGLIFFNFQYLSGLCRTNGDPAEGRNIAPFTVPVGPTI